MKQWIVGAGLLLGLVCIGRVNGWSLVREHPVDELRVEGPYAALTARYVQELLNQLKDAPSARFKNVTLRRKGQYDYHLCGDVNAKNGFGGYVGFRRFVVHERDGKMTVMFADEFMDIFVEEYCDEGKLLSGKVVEVVQSSALEQK